MPPEGHKPLSKDEIDILKNWIELGAKTWDVEDRPFIDSQYVTSMIGIDINEARKRGLPTKDFRYLSLDNLWNDGVSNENLVKVQDAVSKVMNLVSRVESRKRTEVLDVLGLVIRIDLRDYGLTPADWKKIIEKYPYGNGLSYVWADWFCVNVSVPPLYYDLRKIPLLESDFEKGLGIKPEAILRRAGINDSQVALMGERKFLRFETRDGVYWKSLNIKEGNLSTAVDHQKFKPDYSVSMYSLPNDLFGFAVFQRDEDNDQIFRRVDSVDIDAEFDPTKISGTPHIIPMLSCVTCHIHGTQPNVRDVTGGTAVDFLQQDKEPYIRAVREVSETLEPIRSVAERYNRPVDLNRASNDLGIDRSEMQTLIKTKPSLSELGPLNVGKTVSRRLWQDVHAKRVARFLKGESR